MDRLGVSFVDIDFMYTAGTFDVQDVAIEEKSSGHEITCYFAPGSQTKGCRIVIIQEGRSGECQLNTTAARLEGAGDAVVNVELPAGEYSVAVYDDEQVTEENPAYTTTLSIPGATTTSVVGMACKSVSCINVTLMLLIHAGCVFDKETESTSDSEENHRELSKFLRHVVYYESSGLVVLLVIGTVSTVALIAVLTLIAVTSLVVLSRKCIGNLATFTLFAH